MCGIGSPRAPAFRSRKQVASHEAAAAYVVQGAQQPDLGGWKGIGLAKLAHRDVLRGPFTDPGQRAQLRDGLLEAAVRAEEERVGSHRNGQRLECPRALHRDAEFVKIRGCQSLWTGEYMCESLGSGL